MRRRHDAVLLDLLTALLGGWWPRKEFAGSEQIGHRWREALVAHALCR
jgi:hypothetical protein